MTTSWLCCFGFSSSSSSSPNNDRRTNRANSKLKSPKSRQLNRKQSNSLSYSNDKTKSISYSNDKTKSVSYDRGRSGVFAGMGASGELIILDRMPKKTSKPESESGFLDRAFENASFVSLSRENSQEDKTKPPETKIDDLPNY